MIVAVVCFLTSALGAAGAMAHCDAENGPVAVDARKALANDNFKTVAIWVGEKQHEELRSAFDRAIAIYSMGDKTIASIRGMGDKAQELAEQYFMETAVRLHREAGGCLRQVYDLCAHALQDDPGRTGSRSWRITSLKGG